MAYPSGSSNLYTSCPISFMIVKGPYLFWSSFFENLVDWIFLASNYTCFLFLSSCDYLLFLLYYFFMVSFVFSINIFASSHVFFILFKNSSRFGISVSMVRFPFYGCLSQFRQNKVQFVATCSLLLYWNSAVANYFVQLSCQ